MSGDYPFPSKIVSPAKCNEKPWDLWISEIGHLSPRPDDDGAFVAPAPAETKGGASRRVHDAHPYKRAPRGRYRRSGLHRLRHHTMSLHGLFPQMDNLNAAVCHMCGVIVKCSAAYRHLVESHADTDALLPPPPPAMTVRNRSRHKKEQLPPSPVEMLPIKRETSPAHTVAPPLSRIVLPQQDLYLDEAGSSAVTGEVQVCVESGELPVVSIQDTEELPLGENLTDDIFAIMNSEGIQSADDITNSADWKNIIRDIGNLQDLNFSQTTDAVQTPDLYAPALHTPLSAYSIPEADLSALQFAAATPPPPAPAPAPRPPPPAAAAAAAPPAKAQARSKSSKVREYDANKHCGVLTADHKPCTRSLTCKAHALSLRRCVEGRAKPFDTLLAEHRASREAAAAPAPPPPLPPLLVNTSLDLSAFNGLTAEQQVNDIYASLLSVEEPGALLPDTSGITSLLSQPLAEPFLLPDEAEAGAAPPSAPTAPSPAARPRREEEAPPEVCWYGACPRPLALCAFNASLAGGAVALGKRYATVRANMKSSLSRSQKAAGGALYCGASALALATGAGGKSARPELRRLVAGGAGAAARLATLLGARAPLNGHVKARAKGAALGLAFLDPLLADDKC